MTQQRRWTIALSLTVPLCLMWPVAVPVDGQDIDRVNALVERAGRYIQGYAQAFSTVVCEEHQVQRVTKFDGTVKRQRDLVSDVLLVKIGDQVMTFRDVATVDGKPVRDRRERLQKLFIGQQRDAVAQAGAIARESARYNIGFGRDMDALMLPLAVLHPRFANRFVFTINNGDLAFFEDRSPTLVGSKTGRDVRDMFLRGRAAIDAATGRLETGSLVATNAIFEMTFDIRYAEDATLALLVPKTMEERYRHAFRPKDDRLEVSSSFGNFRRFQVKVDEKIDLPQ